MAPSFTAWGNCPPTRNRTRSLSLSLSARRVGLHARQESGVIDYPAELVVLAMGFTGPDKVESTSERDQRGADPPGRKREETEGYRGCSFSFGGGKEDSKKTLISSQCVLNVKSSSFFSVWKVFNIFFNRTAAGDGR